MKILAVETATEACSAAVFIDGAVLEHYQLAPREHNRLILGMIEAVLDEAGLRLADVDGLAFGRGPGSFTGVRIAAGVIQGLALGSGLPVVPVSTLAALASEAFAESDCAWAYPCIDARMGEVYFATFRRDGDMGPVAVEDEAVLPADQVAARTEAGAVGIGSGWATYGESLGAILNPAMILTERYPRAGHIARLGAAGFAAGLGVDAALALPVYVRDNVAKKPGER